MSLDLPLIWAVIIATAVLLYVLLDGFDTAAMPVMPGRLRCGAGLAPKAI